MLNVKNKGSEKPFFVAWSINFKIFYYAQFFFEEKYVAQQQLKYCTASLTHLKLKANKLNWFSVKNFGSESRFELRAKNTFPMIFFIQIFILYKFF